MVEIDVDRQRSESEPAASNPEISVTATEILSYALAHNRIPVIHELTISGIDRPIRGATLEIELRDAEGPIGDPLERIVDLEPGSETVLTSIGFTLDPGAMLQIEEQRPGRLTARLRDGEQTLAERPVDVQLLAANQWLGRPPSLALEMLAAFVMPNHPAITAFMSDVAGRLERTTGSPSLQGYQAGPERVAEIVAATLATMHERRIRYAEAPASWADAGQKVRTPEEVLEGRVGTCLDTTVTLAAALEQAGIRSTIWIVQGHSFVGYWRDERALGATAVTEVGDVVNLVDLGLMGLIETTLVTDRDPLPSLEQTHRSVREAWLSGHAEKVLGVTDVYRARRDGIVPLPARRRAEDGAIVVTEYRPQAAQIGLAPTPAPDARRGERDPRPHRASAPPRVAQWKNALLDLSLRNRLINFTDSARIELTVPGERLAAFEDAINQGTGYTLLPADRIAAVHRERGLRLGRELPVDQIVEQLVERRAAFTDVGEGAYLRRMRNLAYQARTLIEETGANNLYLAFGALIWSVDGRPLRSPLILVPVQIAPLSRQGLYRVALDESGASAPNYCLLEKLRQLHGLEIPELENPAEDGAGVDLDRALQATRLAIGGKGLGYRVEPTVDLAILQFAKFRLWKDLDENWQTFSANPLVRHLIETPFDPFVDPAPAPEAIDLDELAAVSPMPADSSQLAAVAEAVAGRTFVLEGPPGTGKSQTITNLLTRAIAEGKRVLFVAEKRAALDVVQTRLDEVGLGPFSLDLHDRHSRPLEVRAQIRRALEQTVEVDRQGMANDYELLGAARGALVRYARRLHEENAAGLSYYSARTQELTTGDDVPAFPVPEAFARQSDGETVARVRRVLSLLPDVADPARPSPRHPWGFIDPLEPAALNPAEVRSAALEFDAAVEALPETGPAGEALREVRTPDDLAVLATFLGSTPWPPLETLDRTRTPQWEQASDVLRYDLQAFAAAKHEGLEVVTVEALALPLRDIDEQARAALNSGFFGRKGRVRAAADRLTPALRPGAKIDLKRLGELTGSLASLRATAEDLTRRAGALAGLVVPAGWNPLKPDDVRTIEEQIHWLRWAGGAVDPVNQGDHERFVLALRGVLAAERPPDRLLTQSVMRLSAAARALAVATAATGDDFGAWSGEIGLIARWRETAPARRLEQSELPTLRAWLALLEHVVPLRRWQLNTGRVALLRGAIPAGDAVRAFDRGLAEASRRERAAATGLEGFDAAAQGRNIRRFLTASTAVRKHLLTAVPDRVLAARTFDANAGAGQVGQLQRQLSRQRGGMGVRTLLNTFGELITGIMPCVLVSPDSVARFFPAQAGLFDIVVFDEASQIRVADAIGAMGRGKSVVVVGDSKQMPPTSFGEPSIATDEAFDQSTEVAEDEESILTECVQARVPRRWLSWHYRSQDESLIAFSNQQYYDQKLSSFPAPVHGDADPGPDGHGISLVRVDGQFLRSGKGAYFRTNRVEADAIVAELVRRFDASPERAPSIGVVTFNIQQRNLIESLLRDLDDQRIIEALDDPDGLFVKNLENVQGDERDVIFFSTAFSVNERGYLPLNFGPLNRAGGERRLNVAITRARRQVVVFSSFDPEQLRAEETSSAGVKHLRAYLDLAAQGTRLLPQDGRRRAAPDRHREEIAAALREWGYAVRTDVGLSEFRIDLVVSAGDEPERPVMAILLDGPVWAARRTAGDRDGLPAEVLSRMLRWPAVERVWMPAWLADRETVLTGLEASFAAALERVESQTPPSVVDEPLQPSDDEPETRSIPVEIPQIARSAVAEPRLGIAAAGFARESLEEPFVPWSPGVSGSIAVLDALPAGWAAARVANVLREGIEAEGPIHIDRLVRLVASSFGLSRVSEARSRAILNLLDPTCRRDDEPFAWPARLDPQSWRGFRSSPDGGGRPIEQISRAEIVNAMTAIAHASAGIDPEELKRQTLNRFGGRRMTTNVAQVLTSSLAHGVMRGRLTIGADGIVRASSGD